MFSFLRDKYEAARLRARYRLRVQEQLLELVESGGPSPVADEAGDWLALGEGKSSVSELDRIEIRTRSRRFASENPYARNILRLLEVYVIGPGLEQTHLLHDDIAEGTRVVRDANRLWDEFLLENRRHFSYGEFARRTWRDGECFLRLFPQAEWPPTVRFIDPEVIAATEDSPGTQGIVTDPHDVEMAVRYLRIDLENRELLEEIPAGDVIHTRIGVDSNQKRGVSIFAPVLGALSAFEKWLDTELTARKLQTSIVLWRRIQGGAGTSASFADGAASELPEDGSVRRERYRPGTILTTSRGTDLQFLQPNTNFDDAVPLGRLLLLSMAAGAGLPEFMVTADASNANFSSTMVAEGPAVKMFQSEQEFFMGEFRRLWKLVMQEAVSDGRLPSDFFEQVTPHWTFPKLITRDRPTERMADARLVKTKVLSRAEIARRDGADPQLMQSELSAEQKLFGD